MDPAWWQVAATVFGVTFVPLGSLLYALHMQNRAAAAKENAERKLDNAMEAKRRKQRFRKIFRRLDHLDACTDSTKAKVDKVLKWIEERSATEKPT